MGRDGDKSEEEMKNIKGVAPALAVVLLAAVTVGVVTTAYYGISSLTSETQVGTSSSIGHEFDVRGQKALLQPNFIK
ncbi:MAG: hypothetical protein H8D26_01770 [Methanomicrobia archaeon]|nr:hypothetical protein [Methanomicrobia archaeon]